MSRAYSTKQSTPFFVMEEGDSGGDGTTLDGGSVLLHCISGASGKYMRPWLSSYKGFRSLTRDISMILHLK
jgi:hypothetical protein